MPDAVTVWQGNGVHKSPSAPNLWPCDAAGFGAAEHFDRRFGEASASAWPHCRQRAAGGEHGDRLWRHDASGSKSGSRVSWAGCRSVPHAEHGERSSSMSGCAQVTASKIRPLASGQKIRKSSRRYAGAARSPESPPRRSFRPTAIQGPRLPRRTAPASCAPACVAGAARGVQVDDRPVRIDRRKGVRHERCRPSASPHPASKAAARHPAFPAGVRRNDRLFARMQEREEFGGEVERVVAGQQPTRPHVAQRGGEAEMRMENSRQTIRCCPSRLRVIAGATPIEQVGQAIRWGAKIVIPYFRMMNSDDRATRRRTGYPSTGRR